MNEEASISVIKHQIKSWEHEFRRINNRLPTKSDIKSNDAIYKLYKQYGASTYRSHKVNKDIDGKRGKEDNRGFEVDIHIFDSPSDVEEEAISNSENINKEPKIMHNSELGPTPQANGKVLSIFDVKLTPPVSSPLLMKNGTAMNKKKEASDGGGFKTPQRKPLGCTNLQSSKNLDPSSQPLLLKKLENALHETNEESNLTPARNIQLVFKYLETPQYIRKTNRKFDFQNSPLAKEVQANALPRIETPENRTEKKNLSYGVPLTPTKSSPLNFRVSPTPLKTNRVFSFGNKRLAEIFDDFKTITSSEDIAEEETSSNEAKPSAISPLSPCDEHYDLSIAEQDTYEKKRVRRTTRRWRLRPDTEEAPLRRKVDVHREIQKLDAEQKGVVNSHDNESEVEEDGETTGRQKRSNEEYAQSSKNKILPTSTNYQRLKINNPQIRAFKRRQKMRR